MVFHNSSVSQKQIFVVTFADLVGFRYSFDKPVSFYIYLYLWIPYVFIIGVRISVVLALICDAKLRKTDSRDSERYKSMAALTLFIWIAFFINIVFKLERFMIKLNLKICC